MKNRFSAYLASAKLARLHLTAAEDALRKEKTETAWHNLFRALDNTLVAMNNAASIGFNQKPKARRAPKPAAAPEGATA